MAIYLQRLVKCGGLNVKNATQELPKEAKALIELAKNQGWEYSKTSSGHHRLVSPQGRIVMNSGTPSDYRSVKNFRAELKRWGLKPRTIPVIVKERQNVTVHEIPKPTIAILAAPLPPEKKSRRTSDVRGHLLGTLIPLMRKLDKPEGITVDELRPDLLVAFPNLVISSLASTLSYHASRKTLVRTGHGRYRLAELAGKLPATPPTSPQPSTAVSVADVDVEEDIRILDEALAALAKIDQVVRKHREIVKQMAALKKALGG